MNIFENLMELLLFDESIDLNVKLDVNKRVSDWCSSGGHETDPYIKQQYDYLLRIKSMK